jgi:hypothetical protein
MRAYWRLFFRLSTRVVHRGVTIGILWPTAAEHGVVDRVKNALDLLALHAPVQLKRLRDLVNGVTIQPGGPAGSYISAARVITLRYSETLDTPLPSSAEIAATLVHEATHAYLDSLGLKGDATNRHRVEYICSRAEILFARRLPEGGSIIESAEFILARPAAFWSPESRRQRQADYLRELNLPVWLVSAILRIGRFGSQARAAELPTATDERDS